jgi:hypothetical protein
MFEFELLDRMEKVERRFLYWCEGARCRPCDLMGGEVMSGGNEERFGLAAGGDRDVIVVVCDSVVCGDST